MASAFKIDRNHHDRGRARLAHNEVSAAAPPRGALRVSIRTERHAGGKPGASAWIATVNLLRQETGYWEPVYWCMGDSLDEAMNRVREWASTYHRDKAISVVGRTGAGDGW